MSSSPPPKKSALTNKRPYTIIGSQIAWSCPWYRVRQDDLRLENGHTAVYNVIEKSDAVYVLPITPAGEIVLIHTYRHTIQQWSWELPAGNIQPGQTALDAAVMELREEVGGVSSRWQKLGEFYAGNGICNEKTTLFLARDVSLTEAKHEPLEFIEIHTLDTAVVQRLMQSNEINDALTVLAILWLNQLNH